MKNFKKIIAAMLAVIIACGLFAACSNATKDDAKDASNASADAQTESDVEYIKNKGTLVVGITDYAPMDYKEKGSDEWTGFDAEFAREVGKRMGVEVELVPIKWESKYNELNTKNVDCLWNGMTITDAVLKNASASDAYATNSQVVVVKKENLDKYATTESLKDITIAVEKSSAGEEQAKKYSSNVVSLDAQSDALKEVLAGTSDACIIDSTMANSMTGEGTDFADLGFKLSLTTEEYGVGFRKGSDMVELMNKYIAECKEDGTLDKLSEKYGVDIAK